VCGRRSLTIRSVNFEAMRATSTPVAIADAADAADVAVTGSEDCTVKIWNLESCELRRTLEGSSLAAMTRGSTCTAWAGNPGLPLGVLRSPDRVLQSRTPRHRPVLF